MGIHVLIVSANLPQSDSLRNAVCRNDVNLQPITATVVANFDGALREVRHRNPHVILAFQSFFTHKAKPDPHAWVLLARALMNEHYRGILGLLSEGPMVEQCLHPKRVTVWGQMKFVHLNLKHYRGVGNGASGERLWLSRNHHLLEEIQVS